MMRMDNSLPVSKEQEDSEYDDDLIDLDIDQIYKDIGVFFKRWHYKEMN